MSEFNEFHIIIAGASIIILSYLFNLFTEKTNIPSVLLLILLGVVSKPILSSFDIYIFRDSDFLLTLKIVGTVGLILIVLEASLDLKLRWNKARSMLAAFTVAILGVLLSSGIIMVIFYYSVFHNWLQSGIYAIPISIISSAIVIPSTVNLKERYREFLIYESAFSDILGIMAFFLFISNVGQKAEKIAIDVGGNIGLTLVLSFVVSYLIIVAVQNLHSHVKFILLMAVLCLIYAAGKIYHLSPLLAILLFGLIINNKKVFFTGFMGKFVKHEQYDETLTELKKMTAEAAFLVRTFFFFIFGLSIKLTTLIDFYVIFISLVVLIGIYIIRFGLFKVFVKGPNQPMVWVAPRGLITILLFYSIPKEYISTDFRSGILLFVIIASSLVMSWGILNKPKYLTKNGKEFIDSDEEGLVEYRKTHTQEEEENDGQEEPPNGNQQEPKDPNSDEEYIG